MSKKLNVYDYDGEGFFKVYSNKKWIVAVKNYKAINNINHMDYLERHNQTDELFIPVEGECTLVIAERVNGEFIFETEKLEKGKIYSVVQGTWHNAVMDPDTKLAVVEAPDTNLENSEVANLNEEEIAKLINTYARK